MVKVASIGECMVQMLQQPDGRYIRNYAGDTQNFAQYLAWIGKPHNITSSYVTVIGADKFGQEMLQCWKNEGLDTSHVMTTSRKNTGLYFADTDKDGHRNYTYYRSDAAARLLFDMPETDDVIEALQTYDVLYASAISLMILTEENREKMIHLYKKSREKGIKTVFDTNYRPAGWKNAAEAADWMNKIFPYCHTVLPTDDENQAVFGDKKPQDTVHRLMAHSVQEVAVKCGAAGCTLGTQHNGETRTDHIPSQPDIKVVDTTSAGDSFNAGYLCGRLSGQTESVSATWGHKLAAKVIQYQGAFIPRGDLTDF